MTDDDRAAMRQAGARARALVTYEVWTEAEAAVDTANAEWESCRAALYRSEAAVDKANAERDRARAAWEKAVVDRIKLKETDNDKR